MRTFASRRRLTAAVGPSAAGAAAAAGSCTAPTTAVAAVDSAALPSCLRFKVGGNEHCSNERLVLLVPAAPAAPAGGRRHPPLPLAASLLPTALLSARAAVPVERRAEASKRGRLGC